MTSWLPALVFLPLVLAARMRAVERRVAARFRDAGADTPERAILPGRDGPVHRFVAGRLRHAGVLRAAGHDRYYWDAGAYARFRRRRRRRAAVVTIALLAALLVLVYRGDLSP